jgi:hypothetical protein
VNQVVGFGGQLDFSTLGEDRYPTWQSGGDFHVFFEDPFGLMRVTDFKDSTLLFKLNPLLFHRLFEIMDRHDAEFVFHDGLFKILANLINCLRAFNLV